MRKFKNLDFIAPLITLVVLFSGLELFVRLFNVPRWILPAPSKIIATFVKEFFPLMLTHFLATIQVVGTGFIAGVLIGVTLAILLYQYKILDKAFSPYVVMLVTTPLITLVPLLMLWLGFGNDVKIIAVSIQTFPIVLMNSLTGFNNVEVIKLELMKSMGAGKLHTFKKVIFPSALPSVFTGIKLGGIFATIAAIGAEFVGGNVGLGNRIVFYTSYIQTERAFAFIFLVSLIGISLYLLLTFIQSRIIRWEI